MQVIRSQDEDSIRRLLYRSINGEGSNEVLLQIEKKAFQCDASLLRKNGNYDHVRRVNNFLCCICLRFLVLFCVLLLSYVHSMENLKTCQTNSGSSVSNLILRKLLLTDYD